MSLGLVREMPGAAGALLGLVPIMLTAAAFTLMYYVVPNRPVELKHAIVGGIAAAVMFEAMKHGFALYLGRFPSYTLVYGAFAALPIFLVWIYFSWVVVLLGAVITALLPDLRVVREAREARAGPSLRYALEILRVLIGAQRESRTLRTSEILAEARAPREPGERALEEMATAGWTARLVGDRWSLACDPDLVTIADVYKRLVLEPTGGRGRPRDAVIDRVIERAAGGIERAISAPISALVEAEDAGEAARDAPQGARTADRRGRAGPSANLRR
jgi:membrane protein